EQPHSALPRTTVYGERLGSCTQREFQWTDLVCVGRGAGLCVLLPQLALCDEIAGLQRYCHRGLRQRAAAGLFVSRVLLCWRPGGHCAASNRTGAMAALP